MNRVRKKMVLYAEVAVFVFLTALLAVINMINFTMVSEDADKITQVLSDKKGSFDGGFQEMFPAGFEENKEENANKEDAVSKEGESSGISNGGNSEKTAAPSSSKNPGSAEGRKMMNGGRMGPMGPDSPEMKESVRYFTYAFDNKTKDVEQIAYRMSVVTEEEAQEWAEGLVNENVGWTKGTYRYRVYEHNNKTYVTVIDYGRELLPSYRILMISICGEIIVLVLSFLVLLFVSKKLFAPLEEADRKQKQFIANVEGDFKMPLTVINANTEVIERETGSSDYTKSINRQVRKMTKLLKRLSALAIFEDQEMSVAKINLSNLLNFAIDRKKAKFEQANIALSLDIEADIMITGDEESLRKVCSELIDNSLKFAETQASYSLKKQDDRVLLVQKNDVQLPSGSVDQVFDRFTMLGNAEGKEGAGLGLSYVKEIVKMHNGRVGAKVNEGIFELSIDL